MSIGVYVYGRFAKKAGLDMLEKAPSREERKELNGKIQHMYVLSVTLSERLYGVPRIKGNAFWLQ